MKAVKALKCVGLQATFRETLEVLAAKFKHTFFVPGAPVSTRSAGRAQSALWCLLWCLFLAEAGCWSQATLLIIEHTR